MKKIPPRLRRKKGPNEVYPNFYYWFFKGMYKFKQKRFVKAIGCYKTAEQKVSALEDDVEKAEFYDKLAEIYYYISQRYLSINYAMLASDIFNRDYMPLLKSWL